MKTKKKANHTKAKGPARSSLEHLALEAVAGRSVCCRWYRHVPGLASPEENREHAGRIVGEWRGRGFRVSVTQGGMVAALEAVRPGVAVVVVGEPRAAKPQRVRVVWLAEPQAFASG